MALLVVGCFEATGAAFLLSREVDVVLGLMRRESADVPLAWAAVELDAVPLLSAAGCLVCYCICC